jgi:uncharacterized repeat protein (TIGR04076 family)
MTGEVFDAAASAFPLRLGKNVTRPEGYLSMTGDSRPIEVETDMELFDLRVTVDRIEGRSACGLQVGDYFELVNSAELRIPPGRHFCIYALQAVLPMLPAKQRRLPAGDWLERDSIACCPDPEERLTMRIDRIGICRLNSRDLT